MKKRQKINEKEQFFSEWEKFKPLQCKIIEIMNFQKIKEFFENLDFKVEIEKFKDPHALFDTLLKINGEIVYANIKKEMRPNDIPNYLEIAKQQLPNSFLAGADYITPKSKETLKVNGINYIDSYVNTFLDLKTVKIFIEKTMQSQFTIFTQRSSPELVVRYSSTFFRVWN